jgi:hypothetical protein
MLALTFQRQEVCEREVPQPLDLGFYESSRVFFVSRCHDVSG